MFINKHLQSLNFPQISSFWKRLVFFVYNLTSVLLPRQFPFTGPTKEFTTLRAWVFLQKSWQFGFSLTLPLCCWHPKNFSKGSWQSFSLRNDFTPGMLKRYGKIGEELIFKFTRLRFYFNFDGTVQADHEERTTAFQSLATRSLWKKWITSVDAYHYTFINNVY